MFKSISQLYIVILHTFYFRTHVFNTTKNGSIYATVKDAFVTWPPACGHIKDNI